jgi:hypothetical protein
MVRSNEAVPPAVSTTEVLVGLLLRFAESDEYA